jgi:hypothetical protein
MIPARVSEREEMKTLAMFIALLVAVCSVPAIAGLDAYDSVTVKVLTQPLPVDCVAVTNTAVDIAAAKGTANLVVSLSPGYTNAAVYTNKVVFQTSTASAGTYTTVTSATTVAVAGTGVVSSIKVDTGSLSRYVRTIISTAGDKGTASAVLIYPK